jgi:hypothetical protein
VSSNSDNNAGNQTTTTSIEKIDELETGNNSPCGKGKRTFSAFRVQADKSILAGIHILVLIKIKQVSMTLYRK